MISLYRVDLWDRVTGVTPMFFVRAGDKTSGCAYVVARILPYFQPYDLDAVPLQCELRKDGGIKFINHQGDVDLICWTSLVMPLVPNEFVEALTGISVFSVPDKKDMTLPFPQIVERLMQIINNAGGQKPAPTDEGVG